MARKSSIDRLPAEIQELIGRLRERGRTIDEILAKLAELDVEIPRSTLGRHIKRMDERLDAIGEKMRQDRVISEVLVDKLGDAPESRMARLNNELMQGALLKLIVGEEDETVKLDPKEANLISSSLRQLAIAAKTDAERELKIREEAEKKTKAAVVEAIEQATGEKGLTEETTAAVKKLILGMKVAA